MNEHAGRRRDDAHVVEVEARQDLVDDGLLMHDPAEDDVVDVLKCGFHTPVESLISGFPVGIYEIFAAEE